MLKKRLIGVRTVFMKQKKFYCLAAAAVLVLCFASCSSDSGGTKSTLPDLSGVGTASAPFLVSSAADLLKIGKGPDGSWTRNALEAHYELTTDIDMTGINWKPIGDFDIDQLGAQFDGIDDIDVINDIVSSSNFDSTFRGSFDGAGKKIKIGSTSDLPALFIAVGQGSTVKNLELEDGGIVVVIFYGTIEDCYATDGITGVNFWGTIKNCYVTGNVTGDSSDEEVGGIAGVNFGTIENCYVTGNVTGNERVGGIVGTNLGMIKSCHATGSVTGDESVGGIVGINTGTIESCYTTGNVTGNDSQVGGIVGANGGGILGVNGGKIENCYATGDVTGNDWAVGGIAGSSRSTIENCYATGNIKGNEDVGGIVGCNSDGGTIKNCYATGTVTGDTRYAGGIAGGNYIGSTIENCVALNATVTAPSNVGRVIGNDSTTGLSNNHARDNMTGSSFTNIALNNKDGDDISSWDPAWFVSIGFTDSWWTDKLPTYP